MNEKSSADDVQVGSPALYAVVYGAGAGVSFDFFFVEGEEEVLLARSLDLECSLRFVQFRNVCLPVFFFYSVVVCGLVVPACSSLCVLMENSSMFPALLLTLTLTLSLSPYLCRRYAVPAQHRPTQRAHVYKVNQINDNRFMYRFRFRFAALPPPLSPDCRQAPPLFVFLKLFGFSFRFWRWPLPSPPPSRLLFFFFCVCVCVHACVYQPARKIIFRSGI